MPQPAHILTNDTDIAAALKRVHLGSEAEEVMCGRYRAITISGSIFE
jgi:hypothetical protein